MSSKDKKRVESNKKSEQSSSKTKITFNVDRKKHFKNVKQRLDKAANTLYSYENKTSTAPSKKDNHNSEKVEKENVTLKQKVLASNDENIIELIKQAYNENKKALVRIDNILPLFKRKDFIDLIIEERISFTAEENKVLANDYCEVLFYMSDKLNKVVDHSHDLGKVMTSSANEFAANMGATFDKLDEQKITSYNGKATFLNNEGIKTLRGKYWTSMAVKKHIFTLAKNKSRRTKEQSKFISI